LKQPGIDVNAKDDRGKTALEAALVNEKNEVARILEKYA
jgi:ankyrin repeat protein